MPAELSFSLEQSMDSNEFTPPNRRNFASTDSSSGPLNPNDNRPLENEASPLERQSSAFANAGTESSESFLPSAEFAHERHDDDDGLFAEDNQDDENDINYEDVEIEDMALSKSQPQDEASGDTALLSKSPSNPAKFPARSILKADVDEEIPVRTNKNRWKQLPAPDMKHVKMQRIESLDSIASRNSTSDLLALAANNSSGESKQPQLAKSSPKSPTPVTKKSNSKVSFQHIFVREYQQTIGDNPGVGYGAPISLDWDYQEDEPLHVDQYESGRGRRRNMEQMHLNHHRRKSIFLEEYGFTEKEVKAAERATDKAKSQREFSKFVHMSMPGLLAIEEVRESAVRKFRRYRRKKSIECDNPNIAWVEAARKKERNGGDVVVNEEETMRRVQSAPCL